MVIVEFWSFFQKNSLFVLRGVAIFPLLIPVLRIWQITLQDQQINLGHFARLAAAQIRLSVFPPEWSEWIYAHDGQ
jgi:hypothetical protein